MDWDGREFLNVEISEKEKKSINQISFRYVNSEIHVTLKTYCTDQKDMQLSDGNLMESWLNHFMDDGGCCYLADNVFIIFPSTYLSQSVKQNIS